jgi:anti-sigma regulatory factor (Ser/Thr protein kinase)
MTPMAPPTPYQPAVTGSLPPVKFARRVPLHPDPGAAARARDEIEAAVCAWGIPVDLDVAVLLASELFTNAVIHGMKGQPGPVTVTLAIAADATGLRVDVHDASACLPVIRPVGEDTESGRGLLLVSSLSDEWGYYRTPPGKAVYFTLKSAT